MSNARKRKPTPEEVLCEGLRELTDSARKIFAYLDSQSPANKTREVMDSVFQEPSGAR